MSYLTMPETKTYWWITWSDGQTSKWDTKLWTVAQLEALPTISSCVKVNAAGVPVPPCHETHMERWNESIP